MQVKLRTLQSFNFLRIIQRLHAMNNEQQTDTSARGTHHSRAAKRGGFKRGGLPNLDLSFLFCPFLSPLGLSRFFWDFPELLGDGPGIFPICPFPLSRPNKRNCPERVRDTIWTFPKKSGKPPGLETPRFSFSQIT